MVDNGLSILGAGGLTHSVHPLEATLVPTGVIHTQHVAAAQAKGGACPAIYLENNIQRLFKIHILVSYLSNCNFCGYV